MNDRYKYRVWDKNLKVMHPVWCLTPYGAVIDDLMIAKREISFNDCVIMQCTGIADKNGKLIYEGDVLKNLLNGKKYKVAWVGCQASFELHQILSPNGEDYKKAQPIAIYFANGGFQRFQVLGNIYENPELLEEQCANQLNKG